MEIESGSSAWGFASPDSDYDVLDINGRDIKRFCNYYINRILRYLNGVHRQCYLMKEWMRNLMRNYDQN